MKNTLLIGLILLFSFMLVSCSKTIKRDKLQIRNRIAFEVNAEVPFTGKVIEYFDDEKSIKSEENYKNGLMEGLSVFYYESGQKKSESCYIRGKLTGRETLWRENGMVSTVVEHDTARLVDVVNEFDEKGKPKVTLFASSDPLRLWEKLLLMPQFGKDKMERELKLPRHTAGIYAFVLTDYLRATVGNAAVNANSRGFLISLSDNMEYQVMQALNDCNYLFYEAPEGKYYKVYRNESLKRYANFGKGLGYGQMLLAIHPIEDK